MRKKVFERFFRGCVIHVSDINLLSHSKNPLPVQAFKIYGAEPELSPFAQFAKCRILRCTVFSSYGLLSSTEVETDTDVDAEAETRRLGTELCKRTVKPDLVLVKDALVAGEDIHGARLKQKDVFKYTLKAGK